MENLKYQDATSAFSGKRFLTLLKSDFRINGSHYMKLAFAAVGCFVALSVLVCIAAINDINSFNSLNPDLTESVRESILNTRRASYGGSLLIWCFVITSVLLTVFGSLTFSNLANKRERISAFMIPASRCEKFTLRALVYFFFGLITIIVGILVAALIAQVTFKAFPDLDDSVITRFFHEDFAWKLTLIVGLGLIFGNALYTLGSSFWPRLSWLKTWIVVNVVEWILGILLMIGLFSGQNLAYQMGLWLGEKESVTYIFISVEALLIVACWVGAWFRYRSTQIVQLFMKK